VLRRRPIRTEFALGAIFAILLAFGSANVGCDRQPAPATNESQTETSAAPLTKKVHAGDLDLIEILTAGAHDEDTLPMIVAIHGMGDRPENWVDSFAAFPIPARIFFPRAPSAYGNGFSWFSYPPKNVDELSSGVALAGERVAAAITELTQKNKTRGKPIVTGFSQGGFVSFDLAVHHPAVIDVAFPMSGGLPAPLLPTTADEARACAPIFAMHGTADPIVPISLSRDAVTKIKSLGGLATLEEMPNVGHTVTTAERAEIQQRIATRAIAGSGGMQ
jgi:phospholipase/carboxylesterase